ncbi:lipopolysaccharide biosynthesis protein [Vibrio sp. WXL210]|uniref:lipopolysaccharide biosynthesis protein n=1 Tax=Vibrio sp. WXL210 TaxID=3450709 RepID=UPI003EC7D6B6
MISSASVVSKCRALLSSQAGDMLSYAIALFFMKGLSLLMLPIITRYLSPEQLGQLEILAVTGALLGILFSLALHEALYRFAGEAKGKQQRQIANYLFTLTLVLSFSATLVMVTAIWQFSWPSEWQIDKRPFLILFGSLGIEGALAMALAWLRMQNRAKTFSMICIVTSTLQVIMVITSLEFGFDIEGVLLSSFVAHILQLIWVVQTSRLRLRVPNREFIRQSIRYSSPIMLSGLCAFGLNGAERWFILEGDSFAVLGQYAIAAKFALAMCILVQPFGMWWLPKRFAMLEQSTQRTAAITERGIAYICFLAISVVVFGRWTLDLILTQSYSQAAELLTGAIFMVLGKELCELVNLGLLKHKRSSTLFYINLTTCTLALGCVSLTYQYGVWAVMVIIGIAQTLRAATLYIASQRSYRLPYNTGKICLMVTLTLCGLISLHQTNLLQFHLLIWLVYSVVLASITMPDLFKRMPDLFKQLTSAPGNWLVSKRLSREQKEVIDSGKPL